jgi:hypothetical protein
MIQPMYHTTTNNNCYSLPYASSDESLFCHPNIPSDGSDFKGERLTVQFARGPRHKEAFNGPADRPPPPRPRRTVYRMQITGLPTDTSWQVSIPSSLRSA